MSGDPLGIDEGELAEGGFPALDDGTFDEVARGFALVAGLAGLGGSLAGPLVLDVADGEPEQLDHGVVVGEVPAVLDDLAALVVQRLLRYLEPSSLLAR